ncbi:PhzF family phenazine biosynthesis protein [Maribacter litoralis]|uniref:PhzF family phenazine biosynthesis protein n=1 Tax=Maribacter litoralis TaxID=2059726 RepID=UPI000E30C608|nr:PhzF family phenazine biosynthesis protein [Maribacter litoralis]
MKDKNIKVQIINAFVDNDNGGNPAGLVLNSDKLTIEDKLKIAKKVGLSETAFVSKSTSADFKLDFFTPIKQIAHCGHATVATFSYLKQNAYVTGSTSSKETIDGSRAIKFDGELAFMQQKSPKFQSINDDQGLILKSLNLEKSDLLPNSPIEIVNTGNSFIIVPVKSPKVLKYIKPNFDLINEISEKYDLIGYYVFTPNMKSSTRDASARMFGPRYGITEEAGTGMAAGPLACYIFDKLKIKKKRFLIQQGQFMNPPSPSLIYVDIETRDNNIITGLMAGGKGIVKSEMKFEI